jgi:ribose transport system substrate-binding protein
MLTAATGVSIAADKITVGFSTVVMTDQFFVRLQAGMDKAAERLGVTMIHHNPNFDATAQSRAIENFITQGVNVVMVDAIDPNGILPVLREAKAAGIPVIAVDEVLEGAEPVDAGVGLSNFDTGRQIAEQLLAYADEHKIDKLVIGDVHTIEGAIENARFNGFKSVVDKHPDRMRIAGSVDAKMNADVASRGVEDLLTANPDLNVIFGSGGIYLEGAYAALRSQNATDRVKLVGLDLTNQLLPAFEQGIYVVAVESSPEEMGELAVETAVKLAKGEKVERTIAIPIYFRTMKDLPELKERFGG